MIIRARFRGYAVAVVSVAAAAGLTGVLGPLLQPSFSPLFFAAVAVSSWYGGLGPGLVATALAAAITETIFFPPLYAVDTASVVRVGCFTVVALLVASLYARAHAAQRNAEGLARAREEALAQERAARAEAETASRAKDEFLATLSHELRTPLNAMVGWLWWLRRGDLDTARAAHALETVERNTKALAQLIEDLLDVSRIITGKLRLEMTSVDLADVIAAAIDSVGPAAVGRRIEIALSVEPGLAPIAGDPDRLQQVMWNLLSNAIKFTPEDGRVDVRLDRAGAAARIEVVDTGRGIDPKILPYVFDRFRQGPAAVHGTPGLGLGLSIVRHLVEVHGGSISAASAGEGQGSTFTITLPLVPAATPAPARALHAATGIPAGVLEGLRVLVVDDDRDALTWLSKTLAECGAQVLLAVSVREALQSVERDRPDVLVSDIRLPDEDGYTLIRRVRALEPALGRTLPAVALTAYPRVEDRARALQAGYQMHVPKPVEPLELVAVIAGVAGRAAAA
ncbi:MAG TPA: ATP-binding protein [Methylomirabilota bacterium]|nr:ATP-binding protein [Methylomirabilota bacterium]HEV8615067.1 ATP-binding protein [Methylomirabilota bacterium]